MQMVLKPTAEGVPTTQSFLMRHDIQQAALLTEINTLTDEVLALYIGRCHRDNPLSNDSVRDFCEKVYSRKRRLEELWDQKRRTICMFSA